MKKYFLTAVIALFGITLMAQKSKTETVVIQTNAVCQKCEDRFKEKIPFLKGVTDYSLDLKTSKVTVTYNPQKTNADEIRKGISNIGYDADLVKADPKAREKLPACCKAEPGKGGCSHGHDHGGCGGHKH